MIKSRIPKVLLLLAAFVFFSANTVYFLERPVGPILAAAGESYHFDFSKVAAKKPYLNLKSAILVNYNNGDVIYAKHADKKRPIASITKLMMAMILIDNEIDLTQTATITREDARNSSKSRLKVGFELTLSDLLYAALLNSDNRAARVLARTTSGSIEAFVKEMNFKAKLLGLENTIFFEPTGLDKRNVSTATEVAKLLHHAYSYKLIANITSDKREKCTVVNKKNRQLQMANTNLLVHQRYKVLSGKTGYIQASDYCLTSIVENRKGERLTLVVLGVPGDKLRFKEARRLIDWGFKKI